MPFPIFITVRANLPWFCPVLPLFFKIVLSSLYLYGYLGGLFVLNEIILYIFCSSVILDGISELNALAAWCCNSFIFIASRRQPENKYLRLRELEGLCAAT